MFFHRRRRSRQRSRAARFLDAVRRCPRGRHTAERGSMAPRVRGRARAWSSRCSSGVDRSRASPMTCTERRRPASRHRRPACGAGDGPSGQAPPVSTRQHVESVLDEVLDHADGEPAVRFHLLPCPRAGTWPLLRHRRAGAPDDRRSAWDGRGRGSDRRRSVVRRAAPRRGALDQGAGNEKRTHVSGPPLHHAYGPMTPLSSSAPRRRRSPRSIALERRESRTRRSAAGCTRVRKARRRSAPPLELDERLRVAVQALRTVDCQIGVLLDAVCRRRLHRLAGFRAFADYVRDRVGVAPRTARALMAAARVSSPLCGAEPTPTAMGT